MTEPVPPFDIDELTAEQFKEMMMPLSVLAAVTLLYAARDDATYADFTHWHETEIPVEKIPGMPNAGKPPPRDVIQAAAMLFMQLAFRSVTEKQASMAYLAEMLKRGGAN